MRNRSLNSSVSDRDWTSLWLNTWGSITYKEAKQLGIDRLGDAIHDLRKLGNKIGVRNKTEKGQLVREYYQIDRFKND